MATAMEEDEDTVVEEIPVFLSKTLQDNLYLFQYPTKTQVSNLDHEIVPNCCIKPINEVVKVDFALDTSSIYYDRFKGEALAVAADGKTHAKSQRLTYKHGIMDKQTYMSSRSIEDCNRYMVCLFADKQLHVTPLKGILQMRPYFSHFDKEDKRVKDEEKALNDEDDEEQMQQVTVKFARVGKKDKEKHGYDNFMKNNVEEPWCTSFWHARTSATAELERKKLFAANHKISNALALETNNYIIKLIPGDEQQKSIDAAMPVRVVSRRHLKGLSLTEQLKALLKDSKMLKFNEVCQYLQEISGYKVPAEKVLRILPQVGIIMHGNWVPQSDVLYPNDTFSSVNGVNADFMVRARDYVLYKYSRVNFLYRRQVMTATQLPPEEALEVLQSVARLNADKRWEVMLPPDRAFEQRYPDIVQRQEMVWRATEQTYNEMDYEKSPKRVRKRSVRDPTKSQSATNIQPSTSAEAAMVTNSNT